MLWKPQFSKNSKKDNMVDAIFPSTSRFCHSSTSYHPKIELSRRFSRRRKFQRQHAEENRKYCENGEAEF
jgi:hypothetical protein